MKASGLQNDVTQLHVRTSMNKIDTYFHVRINIKQIKEAVEKRVDIMFDRHMTCMFLVLDTHRKTVVKRQEIFFFK